MDSQYKDKIQNQDQIQDQIQDQYQIQNDIELLDTNYVRLKSICGITIVIIFIITMLDILSDRVFFISKKTRRFGY